MPKALSHQWPSLPVMRSFGRSQSGGKALPRRNRSSAPSAQLYGHGLCCSTAAAPELLIPPTRPLSPGQSFPSHPPAQLFLAVCVCSALEGPIRGREPFPSDVEFSVRNPENVTVEREERRTSAVSASVQKAREEKEESPEVRNGNTEQLMPVHKWTKNPLFSGSILFVSILFYSSQLNCCFLVLWLTLPMKMLLVH